MDGDPCFDVGDFVIDAAVLGLTELEVFGAVFVAIIAELDHVTEAAKRLPAKTLRLSAIRVRVW